MPLTNNSKVSHALYWDLLLYKQYAILGSLITPYCVTSLEYIIYVTGMLGENKMIYYHFFKHPWY